MKNRDRIDALEARLAQAWGEIDVPAVDARWKAGVMDAVRREAGGVHAEIGPPLERLVRSAFVIAAAAAVVVIAFVGARTSALDPSLELARFFASNPDGLLQLVLVL